MLFDLSSLANLSLSWKVGDVSADGDRFLAVVSEVDTANRRPVLIPDFADELRALRRGKQ